MNTTGNYENRRREKYSAAFQRAFEAIHRQLRHDVRRFLKFSSGLDMSRAFKTPDELAKEFGYTLRKDKIDADGLAETSAALALHQVWKDFKDNKAQTAQEVAIARWLDRVVQFEVQDQADQQAEAELEDAA